MNFQSNPVSGQSFLASGNQDSASFTPVQQSGQPPASISTTLVHFSFVHAVFKLRLIARYKFNELLFTGS